ncbi:MAG: NAD-dependent isocitrate dehydrogenase [Myxococcales bacterium]|nr:NAD-dependent isocitrate dehydrogenase [Myxococcales bacterium]
MEVTLIPGSGVGVQITEVVRAAVARVGADVTWDEQNEPEAALASARRTGLVLKGKWIATIEVGRLPPTVALRRALGIHTIVRHVQNVPGLPARAQGVDITIFREASEDIYAGFEHRSAEGVFETVKVTTRAACERIHRSAFAWARAQGRRRVTTVHKANILKKSDGMFLSVGREIAGEFAELTHDDVIVDALCMQLIRKPQAFDVLVAGNLFGDIVSDCAAGMAGGVTVACGIGYGPGVTVFESPHGTTVELVGPDGANPYPMLGLAVDLLRQGGQDAAATALRAACVGALQAGKHSPDMGGTAGCSAIRDAVLERL